MIANAIIPESVPLRKPVTRDVELIEIGVYSLDNVGIGVNRLPFVQIFLNNRSVVALLDSGSGISYCRDKELDYEYVSPEARVEDLLPEWPQGSNFKSRIR